MSVRRAGSGTSVWIEISPQQTWFAKLEGTVHADVAVTGGGSVGITTALPLAEAVRERSCWRPTGSGAA